VWRVELGESLSHLLAHLRDLVLAHIVVFWDKGEVADKGSREGGVRAECGGFTDLAPRNSITREYSAAGE
jgi:hypothetical protein